MELRHYDEPISGQLIVLGKHVTHLGKSMPAAFQLPPDMRIIPWVSFPRMFHLAINWRIVAGPARRDLLESYVYSLLSDPEKELIYQAIRDVVEQVSKGMTQW